MAAITADRAENPDALAWVAPVAILIVAFGIVPYLVTTYLIEAIMLPFLALSLAGVELKILKGYS